MPLKLYPPRAGKTPNYSVRGTYYGIVVDRSAGTPDRKKAQKFLNRIKEDIERGAYAGKGELTFADAALSYLRNGGEATFLSPLVEHFKTTALSIIEQGDLDEAAVLIYPDASPATRNRQVYTPMSAIFKHAGIDKRLRRPKGADGNKRTEWMTPAQAERLLDAAEEKDLEFRIFLALLIYTGLRLSEAIWLTCDNVNLSEAYALVPNTKNNEARALHLPPQLVAELANHPNGMERGRDTVCRFRKNGYLYNLLKEAKAKARLPNVSFHTCRHTWATWMRRYAKLDTKGLVSTGAWKDEKSASRYQHVVVTEEAQRADMLPVLKRGRTS